MVSFAQDVKLHFMPTFQGKELAINKYYHLANGDSVSFSTFRCYISGIELLSKEGHKMWYNKKDNYHLLDIEEPESMIVSIKATNEFRAITCYVGVDSEKSVSGAIGGDLDPENGMYWAWQSGYINFKIEGTCNKVPARNHEFQYHIGGYAGKDKAIQMVVLPQLNVTEVYVNIAFDQFLSGIDMSKQYSVMIPGQEAVQLAKKFAGCFELRK